MTTLKVTRQIVKRRLFAKWVQDLDPKMDSIIQKIWSKRYSQASHNAVSISTGYLLIQQLILSRDQKTEITQTLKCLAEMFKTA